MPDANYNVRYNRHLYDVIK